MADKTVVSAQSRSKIRQLLRTVSDEKGNINLAMLAQSPDLPDRWSFVISAPWIDAEGPRAAIAYLSTKLKRSLDRGALSTIERISALRSDHRLVTTILSFLGIKVSLAEGEHHIWDFVIEDVRVPVGYVFIADPHAEGKKTAGYVAANRNASVR